MTFFAMTGVHAGYGGSPILQGVHLALEPGQIGVIVGPNGAGKSTTLKALFGLVAVSSGTVVFHDQSITNSAPEDLIRLGLSLVPQEFNIFPSMSVHDNLLIGAHTLGRQNRWFCEQVYALFPPLKDKRNQRAGELSGGQRQMVAIGRALMTQPKLLVLDEPTAGLSPLYVDEIFDRIKAINREGVGILMVEQNAKQALAIADCGFVLAAGRNRFTGTGEDLLRDPAVAKSFLGGE